MERLLQSQENIQNEFEKYNNQTEHKLPPLVVNDTTNLTSLLNMVTARELRANRQKAKCLPDGTKLKSAIADALLLIDGFDMKQKSKLGSDDQRLTEVAH
jgi:hypothetical protein